jgi:hypothetical protein
MISYEQFIISCINFKETEKQYTLFRFGNGCWENKVVFLFSMFILRSQLISKREITNHLTVSLGGK